MLTKGANLVDGMTWLLYAEWDGAVSLFLPSIMPKHPGSMTVILLFHSRGNIPNGTVPILPSDIYIIRHYYHSAGEHIVVSHSSSVTRTQTFLRSPAPKI